MWKTDRLAAHKKNISLTFFSFFGNTDIRCLAKSNMRRWALSHCQIDFNSLTHCYDSQKQTVNNWCQQLICFSQGMHDCNGTDVYGAAQQWSPLYGPADDTVEVRGGFPQLIHLCHTTSEVFKAFWCAAAWQSLITAIQPETVTIMKINRFIHRPLMLGIIIMELEKYKLEYRMFPVREWS